MSGRSCEYADVAVAVDVRRRHQGGETVEQLQWHPEQWTGLGGPIVQAFGIERA